MFATMKSDVYHQLVDRAYYANNVDNCYQVHKLSEQFYAALVFEFDEIEREYTLLISRYFYVSSVAIDFVNAQLAIDRYANEENMRELVATMSCASYN